MENIINPIKEIEQYTICLYGEICKSYKPIGSGILIQLDDKFYLISAYHVFDREEEMLKIENDPDEIGIDHDDMESVFIRVIVRDKVIFNKINSSSTSIVFTAYPDDEGNPIINEDTEYTVCHLTKENVQYILSAGKSFYNAKKEISEDELYTDSIIISGFPSYASKKFIGEYRSFKCEINDNIKPTEKCLIRVMFDNKVAYNYEQNKTIKIYGIDGMSGGGIWKYTNDMIFPIGIILKQDPNEYYVEGYKFDLIISDIKELNK